MDNKLDFFQFHKWMFKGAEGFFHKRRIQQHAVKEAEEMTLVCSVDILTPSAGTAEAANQSE